MLLQPGRTGRGPPRLCRHRGVRRVGQWLSKLSLSFRKETYRLDPVRRVFIPKPNGKLRPLRISTVRNRVCMTAAMLVLEPIFDADLPAEQYAYRPGRNVQQAALGMASPGTNGRGRCRSGRLLRQYSAPRTDALARARHRRPTRAASDSDVTGMRCRGDGPERRQNTDDCCLGQRSRHPSGLTDFTGAVEFIHTAVRVGLEEAGAGISPRQPRRHLCRRPCDPVQAGQGGRSLTTHAPDHGQAEADGKLGEDTFVQGTGRGV